MVLEKKNGDFYRMVLESSSASLVIYLVSKLVPGLFHLPSLPPPFPFNNVEDNVEDEMGYDAVSPYEYVRVL